MTKVTTVLSGFCWPPSDTLTLRGFYLQTMTDLYVLT